MAFYTVPYRVLFHDTMAYGTHHFLTNFRFQCEAREHLFFERIVDDTPEGRQAHENLIILTREGYTRNLAPVEVGGKVGILLSFEEPGPSSVRFCFRVVRHDGLPVCAGYQSIVSVSKKTGQIVPAPASLLQFAGPLLEPLMNPSFKDRVHKSGMSEIFSPEIIELGKLVAGASPEKPGPRFRELSGAPLLVAEAEQSSPAPSVVPLTVTPENEKTQRLPGKAGSKKTFLFPGQGAYDRELLRHWLGEGSPFRELILEADQIADQWLGGHIVELVTAPEEVHEQILFDNPDLAQVVMFLNGVLVARALEDQGIQPDLMVGHSAGEFAALCAGGAFSILDGVRIICQRVLSLRSLPPGVGGMLAVFAHEDQVRALIDANPNTQLSLAVVNNPEQAVISGSFAELEAVEQFAASQSWRVARVQSPYPFHNPLLQPCVQRFADAIRSISYKQLKTPVWSPIEQRWLDSKNELPDLLASHFVRPLSFQTAVHEINGMGIDHWIECSGKKVISKTVRKLLIREKIKVDCPGVNAEAFARNTAAVAESLQGQAPSQKSPAVAASRRNGASQSSTQSTSPAAVPEVKIEIPDLPKHSDDNDDPIAIVSMGCVLPGAFDSETFWDNIVSGKTGISDAAISNPTAKSDFWNEKKPHPDKTYTLLGGFIRDFHPDISNLPWSAQEFESLSMAQRYLALALHEAMGEHRFKYEGRGSVVLGSTADGIVETDESLLVAGLKKRIEDLDHCSAQDKAQLGALVERALNATDNEAMFSPFSSYETVAQRLLHKGVNVITVDAACASSLYAVDVGIRALKSGSKDWALCGGVFAPGPANSCLFSQFLGLSSTGSRPFDKNADGVVFGEGAAILGLRRLSDAVAAGQKIYGIIRAIGTSSDGKSPSVAVPKRQGQVLAIERAWEQAQLDPGTAQFVEAHATSTPVGDAVEFSALKEWFGPRAPADSVGLGSVKGLIGHTGWAAGAASLIKMCRAMEAEQFPPQHYYNEPNAKISLNNSPFRISSTVSPWPKPRQGLPKRASISGFGFGGSNAHVILDGYDPSIHKAPAPSAQTSKKSKSVAIVALSRRMARNDARRFNKEELKLPGRMLVMPDVFDDMDRSQILAVQLAHESLGQLPKDSFDKNRIAVILGLTGKTELSLRINKRLYVDRLSRRFQELGSASLPGAQELLDGIRATQASGPYTLPGLMPNVSAGRVANLLNLRGPNLIFDTGEESLYTALEHGLGLAYEESSDLVLAGALNAAVIPEYAVNGEALAEGGVMLALTSFKNAKKLGLKVLGGLEWGAASAQKDRVCEVGGRSQSSYFRGAEGCLEVLDAIDKVAEGQSTSIIWNDAHQQQIRIFPISELSAPKREKAAVQDRAHTSIASVTMPPPGLDMPPIQRATPRWKELPKPSRSQSMNPLNRRVLVITDQDQMAASLPALLQASAVTVLSPKGTCNQGLAVDLASDETAQASLAGIQSHDWDMILVGKNLAQLDSLPEFSKELSSQSLMDLLFVVVRHFQEAFQSGSVSFGSLALNGLDKKLEAKPYTGLLSGFVKSIARQFPKTQCRAVTTNAGTVRQGLEEFAQEFDSDDASNPDLFYRDGRRGTLVLEELQSMSQEGPPLLGPGSVAMITGGARGVTAVLTEEMIRQHGCSVLLLGRTDPSKAPDFVVQMSDEEFENYETQYYSEGRQNEPGVKMRVLKQRFGSLRSAREVAVTLKILRRLSPHVDYKIVDVQDQNAIEGVTRELLDRYGRLDLVIHGAGVQISRQIHRKSLGDFRRVMSTKIGGLVALKSAVSKALPGKAVHFHLLTSAFSFFGNDGQEDYGAANEAMNRLAANLDLSGSEGRWSSMAWLGWAGIGMTRASEYAALAKARKLRPVFAREGQDVFMELLAGPQTEAINILVTQGELNWYKIPLDPPAMAKAAPAQVSPVKMDLVSSPYLKDHLFRNIPTVPGTFEIEIVSQACATLNPGWRVVGMDLAKFQRFLKVKDSAPDTLRVETRLLRESANERVIQTRLLSDFTHSSGKVLEKDIEHFTNHIRMEKTPSPLKNLAPGRLGGTKATIPDPYLLGDSLKLSGFFRCLQSIELCEQGHRALFQIEDDRLLKTVEHFIIPSILLDALCRLSMMDLAPGGELPIYVPIECGESWFASGINDTVLHTQLAPLTLLSDNPVLDADGELIRCAWAQAQDQDGRVIASVKNLVARSAGVVTRVT